MKDARRGHEMDRKTLESRMIRKGQVRFGEGWLEKGLAPARYLVSHLLYIVWDAVEVTEITRRHIGRVRDTLAQIRQAIEQLTKKRDQRKDRFAKVVAKAMQTAYGQDREQTQRLLSQAKFTRPLAQKAIGLAVESGGFSIWSMVNALTQLSRQTQFAGSRSELDQRASALLNLVAA
jgi:hypothetical protein